MLGVSNTIRLSVENNAVKESCCNDHLSECQGRASCMDTIPGKCTTLIFISQTCSVVLRKKKNQEETASLQLEVEVDRC